MLPVMGTDWAELTQTQKVAQVCKAYGITDVQPNAGVNSFGICDLDEKEDIAKAINALAAKNVQATVRQVGLHQFVAFFPVKPILTVVAVPR